MPLIRTIRENVGWKIGVVTTLVLLFVAILIIVSFSIAQVKLFSKFNLIQILVVTVTLLTLLGILTIILTTNHFIQRPVDRLVHAISQAEGGDLTARAQVKGFDEIGELTAKLNEMLRKISELDSRKLKADRELIQAQEERNRQQVLEESAALIERTNQKLERSVKDLSVLHRVSQMISSALVQDELYDVLVEAVVKKLGFQEFALLVYEQERKRLEVKVAYGFKDNQKIKGLSFALGEGISGRVAESKEPVYILDTSRDPAYLHYKGEKMEEGSFLSLPLVSHNRIVAVMNFSRPGTDSFSSMDIQLLTSLGSQVAGAMENARLYGKMKELSVTDELTHVFNRRHFQTMLQMEWKRAKRFARSISMIMIDVDYFKRYNDQHGHVEGDRVLQEIARIFSENVREVDTVARYGGEEFAVLLTHTTSAEAAHVAEKLRKLVEEHSFKYEKNMPEGQVTISLGVANFPDDASHMEDLLNHADIALYQAKSEGRNRVICYNPETCSALRLV